MKKIFGTLMILCFTLSSMAQKIEFESKVIDYGVIEHNSDGNREFKFTSSGDKPLIIKSAKGSCGCTVPKWPKKPIAPGENGEIKVTFNSNNRQGKQQKTVTLVTNGIPNTTVLTITGNIIIPEKKSNK